jgi:exonuclease III
MRVCCWNVRRATASSPAWQLLTQLNPDLALLQEVAALPADLKARYQWAYRPALGKSGLPQRFGTAILVRGTITSPIVLRSRWPWVTAEIDRFNGNLVAHHVTLHNGMQLRVLSAHSPAWPVVPPPSDGIDVNVIRLNNNKRLWVTELLWAALMEAEPDGVPPWIVGGDLNSSVTFDDLWPGGPRGNREIMERMGSLGFTECLRHGNGGLVPTFRNARDGKLIHQIDHLFVTNRLLRWLSSCRTVPADRVFGERLSDHLPIVADFADNLEA